MRRQTKSFSEQRWVMYCHKCHWLQSVDYVMRACHCGNMAARLNSYHIGVEVIANNKDLARVLELTTLLEKHWALVQKPGNLPGVLWCEDLQRAIDEGWKLVEDFIKPQKKKAKHERNHLSSPADHRRDTRAGGHPQTKLPSGRDRRAVHLRGAPLCEG